MYHKNQSSEDLRVKRTHKLILEALLDLTIQKGFAAISVSDIAKRAEINRTTFYRHYRDKFDLLNQYAQSVYAILETPSRVRPSRSAEDYGRELIPGLIAVYEHIRSNAKFYRIMLGKNGDPQFTDQIRQYIQKRIKRTLPSGLQVDENYMDFYLNYRSSATLGAVVWWLEHDMPYTPEEMVAQTLEIETAILDSVLRRGSSKKRLSSNVR